MKTKNIIGILLTVSGIGIVAYIILKLLPASSKTAPRTATTSTATQPSLVDSFRNLFGINQTQQDNTGAYITAGGNAVSSLVKSIGGLFNTGTPTSGTPVASPVSGGTQDDNPDWLQANGL
jgi:hypothetical protein